MTNKQRVGLLEHKIAVLEAHLSMLADVVRDGIELAWGGWEIWEGVARSALYDTCPDYFRELESFNKVRKTAISLGIVKEGRTA